MRLSEKYEFRSIHREEAEQAAEIEQNLFPPAEAISRADVIDRVEKIPELFLVAVDRKNGKLAGYLTGFTTSEEAFQDNFLPMQIFVILMGKIICFWGLRSSRNTVDRALQEN